MIGPKYMSGIGINYKTMMLCLLTFTKGYKVKRFLIDFKRTTFYIFHIFLLYLILDKYEYELIKVKHDDEIGMIRTIRNMIYMF